MLFNMTPEQWAALANPSYAAATAPAPTSAPVPQLPSFFGGSLFATQPSPTPAPAPMPTAPAGPPPEMVSGSWFDLGGQQAQGQITPEQLTRSLYVGQTGTQDRYYGDVSQALLDRWAGPAETFYNGPGGADYSASYIQELPSRHFSVGDQKLITEPLSGGGYRVYRDLGEQGMADVYSYMPYDVYDSSGTYLGSNKFPEIDHSAMRAAQLAAQVVATVGMGGAALAAAPMGGAAGAGAAGGAGAGAGVATAAETAAMDAALANSLAPYAAGATGAVGGAGGFIGEGAASGVPGWDAALANATTPGAVGGAGGFVGENMASGVPAWDTAATNAGLTLTTPAAALPNLPNVPTPSSGGSSTGSGTPPNPFVQGSQQTLGQMIPGLSGIPGLSNLTPAQLAQLAGLGAGLFGGSGSSNSGSQAPRDTTVRDKVLNTIANRQSFQQGEGGATPGLFTANYNLPAIAPRSRNTSRTPTNPYAMAPLFQQFPGQRPRVGLFA